MNYATWKINFTDPNYGTGPEDRIAELGFGAEAGWSIGTVENDGIIIGYLTEALDEADLTTWDFANISQADALNLCQSVNPEAFLLANGKIALPYEELTR